MRIESRQIKRMKMLKNFFLPGKMFTFNPHPCPCKKQGSSRGKLVNRFLRRYNWRSSSVLEALGKVLNLPLCPWQFDNIWWDNCNWQLWGNRAWVGNDYVIPHLLSFVSFAYIVICSVLLTSFKATSQKFKYTPDSHISALRRMSEFQR